MRVEANNIDYSYSGLEEAWPDVDPGHAPCGEFVILQLRLPKKVSKGGIIIIDDASDTDRANTQAAKVIAIGPAAFTGRRDGQVWPGGVWYKVGDYVRCPKYGGDRWEVEFDEKTPEKQIGNVVIPEKVTKRSVTFVLVKELDVKMVITGDPLKIRAFF